MARKAVRMGDIDSDPDVTVTGSPNVFTNNRKSTRVGDIDSEGDVFITGSPNVFIN